MSGRSQLPAIIFYMMTHELEVSILAAPLAQMDRRALSQAWYTALRLASNGNIAGARPTPVRVAPALRVVYPFTERLKPGAPSSVAAAATTSHSRRATLVSDDVQSLAARVRRFTLAERIERAFVGAPMRPKRATFSLGRGSARVHIILQTIGDRPILVALCRPEVRTVVGRALAEARLALARRGIGLELCALEKRGSPPCS